MSARAPFRWLGCLAIASAPAVAQQTTTAWPSGPNVILAPSASPSDPAGPMGGLQVMDDLDRPAQLSDTRPGNWVIAPIPFRNELLGAGLVLGAGYLYGARETDPSVRHSIAAAAGMYAEGGSWTALAAHRGYWSGQRRRTTAAIATGELLYDVELELADGDRTLGLRQKFTGVTLEAATRVGESAWLALGYRGGNTEVAVPIPADELPEEFAPDTTIEMSSLLLGGELDTRDSDLYPHSGRYAQLEALISRHELGSDHDYTSLEAEWNSYLPIRAAHVLAWRVAGKIVEGDTPFFAMSWFGSGVDLRGYTPGRYIGESMIARAGRMAVAGDAALGIHRIRRDRQGLGRAGQYRYRFVAAGRRCRRAFQARQGAAAQHARGLRLGPRRQHVLALHRRGILRRSQLVEGCCVAARSFSSALLMISVNRLVA